MTGQSLVNNPSGTSGVSATYDNMNRISTLSHPNFGASDPNDVLETTTYDGLGRTKKIVHPDSESIQKAYGAAVTALGGLSLQKRAAYGVGFPVLSVDERGNLRQKWLDGFGQVIQLDEPSGAGGLTSANYTNYTYDVLGNLTGVSEGAQSRSYQYDGLSRLIQESTPEAGTVKYSYVAGSALCSGDPSNVCSRTDARAIVTTNTYDSTNRLIGKSYSASSMPNVCTMSNGGSARICYNYGSSAHHTA